MRNVKEHFLWVEKYRPTTIEECILPKPLKSTFMQFKEQGEVPNLLLVGPPGTGKTTVARALLEQLKCDYAIINASLKGNIDTLRNEIASFASSVSFKGGRKYIILDEADHLTHATQPALRNFMETFSKNCGFILTVNHQGKILEALQSRCAVIDFGALPVDAPRQMSHFLKRSRDILQKEGVTFDDEDSIIKVIKKYYPDFRRTLNELQRLAAEGAGKITPESVQFRTVTIQELIAFMKDKNFTQVRKWTTENLSNDQDKIFRVFYDEAAEFFTAAFIPELVVILAKYAYQSGLVVDQEINFAAAMVEIMVMAQWL